MCGLVGYLDPSVDPFQGRTLLKGMTGVIAHRGPDAEGCWTAPSVGLGHRRLSIVGLSDGQQPMLSADGELVITYNGEVFNFVELRAELEARGHHFRTGSDTEVILHLYQAYGLDCVSRLNGDFAFALWDSRLRRLVLVRDRMGVRPLYHARIGGGFYFASEIKALLRVPGFAAQLDPLALDDIFTLWAPQAPRTAFAGVSELPPGHMLVVENGETNIRAYWSLDYPDAGDAPLDGDPVQREEQLRALLEDAVRIRLRADVPVGSYLSGGLDSSIVSAMAARQNAGGLSTFSVAFDSAEHDESRFQHAVASAIGSRHASIQCSGADIARIFPEVIAHAEQPVLRTAPAPLYLLAGLVRDSGLKVVLTGEGADEVFAGYDIFKESRVRRFCARKPGSRIRPLLFQRLYPYLPGLQGQSPEYLASFFGVDGALDDPLFSHRPRFRNTAAAKRLFSPELRAQIGSYDAAEAMAASLPERFARWHPLHQAQYLEARFLLPGYILSAQGDRMAMAHGVEGRFPYLDHRVVEFAAGLPPEMKLNGLEEKRILRRAGQALLPPEVSARPKQPYRAPDSECFIGPDAPEYVAETMSLRQVTEDGLFNPRAVDGLMAKARAQGLKGFRDNAAFVGVLSTGLWRKNFMGETAGRVRAA